MDASVNNPAGRLHEFLDHCSQQSGQIRVSAIWSEYFQTEPESTDYAKALVDVLALPGQLRSALEGAPRSPTTPTEFLVRQLPKVEQALAWGFVNQHEWIGNFNGKYDQGDIARLEMMSASLSGLASSTVTDDVLEEVTDLAEQIAQLVVEDDTLEPDIRDLLLDLSNGLRSVVQSYVIRGPEAIARERDLLVGRLVNNPTLAAKLLGNKKAHHLVRKTVIVTGAVLAFFNTGAQAMDNAPKVLNHLQNITQLFTHDGGLELVELHGDAKPLEASPTPTPSAST